MRFGRVASGLVLAAGVLLAPALASASAPAAAGSVPKLDHVFVVMEENNGFGDVIGNPAAPNLNYLAKTFGLETDYFGVSPCCSEANYVGLLGGNTYGVNSDDAYWKNTVSAPSLISQLDKAGISWKAYLQSLPYAGYEGICYPAKCNGTPDSDPLYVAKHDTIQNFTTSWNSADWSRQVPIGGLASDLRTGDVPRFSYVVPDECHDMHGDPPYCLDSGNAKDPQNQHLVSVGDAYLGHLVSAITSASFWAKGNNAIVVTFDEGSDNAGCCDASPGAGQVATVVITSHGVRGATDPAPANHYSTLSTIQHIFGLGCLAFTCDTAHVKPYTSLFEVTGSDAVATNVLPELGWPTPTPSMPPEPVSLSPSTASAGGWTVQQARLLGQSDNSLGAIAGSSASDVWAVGDYLPDAASSNTDATLAFAEHYDGHAWTVVRPLNAGVNFSSLYGVAAIDGKAWAVGEYLNSAYRDRALLEVWDGTKWSITDIPQPGSVRDMLFGAAALSPSDVWVTGDQEGADGRFETLAEHWDGRSWSVVPTPDPGSAGNHLYGMYAVSSSDIWAVGQQLGGSFPDNGLVEHWDGHSWSVVSLPGVPGASVLLQGVTATASGRVYAVGEADSTAGGRPLIEYYAHGSWSVVPLPASAGSVWTQLFGVAISGGAAAGGPGQSGTAWATGTYVDPKTDNNVALVLTGTGTSWTVAASPQPGSGSNILGSLAVAGGHLWAAGLYDDGGSRLPLVERKLSSA